MKNIGNFVLILLLLVAVLLIILATYQKEPIRSIFLTFGAALVGSILGAITARISDYNNVSALKILKDLKEPGFVTSDNDIISINKKWYFYHLTEYKNEKIWRQSIIDLSKCPSLNKIKGEMYETFLDNKTKRSFPITAGVWGERLIILFDGNDKEAKQVIIFPFFNKSFKSFFSGYAFLN